MSRSRMLIAILLLVSPLSVHAGPKYDKRDVESKEAMKRLESKIDTLQKSMTALQISTSQLGQRVDRLESARDRSKSAAFDPTKPGSYQRVDSSTGTFLVSLSEGQPYPDGYRLPITIGNPNSASYAGFKVAARWGRGAPSDLTAYGDWLKTLKEKEFSFTDDLAPGKWMKVDLFLVPAPKDTLGYVEISIIAPAVSVGTTAGH